MRRGALLLFLWGQDFSCYVPPRIRSPSSPTCSIQCDQGGAAANPHTAGAAEPLRIDTTLRETAAPVCCSRLRYDYATYAGLRRGGREVVYAASVSAENSAQLGGNGYALAENVSEGVPLHRLRVCGAAEVRSWLLDGRDSLPSATSSSSSAAPATGLDAMDESADIHLTLQALASLLRAGRRAATPHEDCFSPAGPYYPLAEAEALETGVPVLAIRTALDAVERRIHDLLLLSGGAVDHHHHHHGLPATAGAASLSRRLMNTAREKEISAPSSADPTDTAASRASTVIVISPRSFSMAYGLLGVVSALQDRLMYRMSRMEKDDFPPVPNPLRSAPTEPLDRPLRLLWLPCHGAALSAQWAIHFLANHCAAERPPGPRLLLDLFLLNGVEHDVLPALQEFVAGRHEEGGRGNCTARGAVEIVASGCSPWSVAAWKMQLQHHNSEAAVSSVRWRAVYAPTPHAALLVEGTDKEVESGATAPTATPPSLSRDELLGVWIARHALFPVFAGIASTSASAPPPPLSPCCVVEVGPAKQEKVTPPSTGIPRRPSPTPTLVKERGAALSVWRCRGPATAIATAAGLLGAHRVPLLFLPARLLEQPEKFLSLLVELGSTRYSHSLTHLGKRCLRPLAGEEGGTAGPPAPGRHAAEDLADLLLSMGPCGGSLSKTIAVEMWLRDALHPPLQTHGEEGPPRTKRTDVESALQEDREAAHLIRKQLEVPLKGTRESEGNDGSAGAGIKEDAAEVTPERERPTSTQHATRRPRVVWEQVCGGFSPALTCNRGNQATTSAGENNFYLPSLLYTAVPVPLPDSARSSAATNPPCHTDPAAASWRRFSGHIDRVCESVVSILRRAAAAQREVHQGEDGATAMGPALYICGLEEGEEIPCAAQRRQRDEAVERTIMRAWEAALGR